MEKIKDEWSQEEYLENKAYFEGKGVKVFLVDTILKPIEGVDYVTYNPFVLKQEPKGSIFVFYCDTGKSSKERLSEFKKKFPEHHCISLRGGKGYWKKHLK